MFRHTSTLSALASIVLLPTLVACTNKEDQFTDIPYTVDKVFTNTTGTIIYGLGYTKPNKPNSNDSNGPDSILAIYETPTGAMDDVKFISATPMHGTEFSAQTDKYLIGTDGGKWAYYSPSRHLNVSIYDRDNLSSTSASLKTFDLVDENGAVLPQNYQLQNVKLISTDTVFINAVENKGYPRTAWDAVPKYYSYILYAPTDLALAKLLTLPTDLSRQACQSIAVNTNYLVCISSVFLIVPPSGEQTTSDVTEVGSYSVYDITSGYENATLLFSDTGTVTDSTTSSEEVKVIRRPNDANFFPPDSNLVQLGDIDHHTFQVTSSGHLSLINNDTTLNNVKNINVVNTTQAVMSAGQLVLAEKDSSNNYGYVASNKKPSATRKSDLIAQTLYSTHSVNVPNTGYYAIAGGQAGLLLTTIVNSKIKIASGHYRKWSEQKQFPFKSHFYKDEGHYLAE